MSLGEKHLESLGEKHLGSLGEKHLELVAERHGIDLKNCQPAPLETRLRQLKALLADQHVPFPIPEPIARQYYELAASGQPFGVGSLSDQTVDLGEYANFQHYDRYSSEEHLSWACLVADQQKTKLRYACLEYLEGEKTFQIGGSVIPDYYLLNARIYQQTGWQLSTVNMIIPAELFFTCHSRRFFPVTTFMRPLEQDYLQEPDIGHDVAGHVATFTIPAVAHVMRNHGLARDLIYAERDERIKLAKTPEQVQTIEQWADELLLYAGRIYWFTVEFGLVMQDGEVRDFGAGILSSPGETIYSIDSTESNRVLIDPACDADLLRLATTDYLISEFQKTYFVMASFEKLESLTPERIIQAAKTAQQLPHFTWREIVPGDQVLNVGKVTVGPNEKYLRLMAGVPIDECLTRAAIRNLRIMAQHPAKLKEFQSAFSVPPPEVPTEIIEWFRQADIEGRFPQDILPMNLD
jgi:phenylalanine-4-hydroxylase